MEVSGIYKPANKLARIPKDQPVPCVCEFLCLASFGHLQGDVPVGLTLSGGIDSSLLAHFMRNYGTWIGPAFTISCSARSGDSIAAKHLAKCLQLEHFEVKPTFSDYCAMIPACVLAEEATPSLYALPFLVLCQKVSGEEIKVCLNGEGSDELFGGYEDYSNPSTTILRLRHALSEAELAGLPVSKRAREIAATICGTRTFNEYFRAMLETYQLEQLEYNHLLIVDRYSMACSIEMRVPFMDDDIVEYVNSLPLRLKLNKEFSISKYLLKHVALHAAGAELYDPVLRSKAGMPSSGFDYLMKFTNFCDDSIPDEFAHLHPYRAFFCETGRGGQIRGKAGLLLFDLFRYFFIEHRGCPPQSFSFSDFVDERMKKEQRGWLQVQDQTRIREAYARG
jgi:asparagine synthase (glutamine-hydrolysing)